MNRSFSPVPNGSNTVTVMERSYLIFSFSSYLIISSHLSILSYQNTRYTHVTAHDCALLRLTGNTCYASRFTHVMPPDLRMSFTIYSVVLVYLYPSRILLESPPNQWLTHGQYNFPFFLSLCFFCKLARPFGLVCSNIHPL